MSAAEPDTHHVLAEVSENGMHGTVSISPIVLTEIIELASAGTEGLVKFVSPGRHRGKTLAIGDDAQQELKGGDWFQRSGIRVRLDNATVDAELSVDVQNSANVPAMADELKRRISEAVDHMLGLQTGVIAIHVRTISPPASSGIEGL
jgi:uncharacterized alkaline shock family protein YloU